MSKPLPMGRVAMIPSAAYIDTRLTSLARDILGIISAHGNTKSAGWCYLYQRTIADLLGVTRQKVNENVRRLVEYGYLEKKSKFLKSGAQTYSWYRVRLDFDLPDHFSRLPAAPDEERADADPPVTVGLHPLSPQGDTPVTVGLHPRHRRVTPIYKDERGNLNGETLTDPDFSSPVFVQESGDEPARMGLTRGQIKAWPWRDGLPMTTKPLQDAGVIRANNGYVALMREEIERGKVPDFRLWEHAHFWRRGVMPSEDDRAREYWKFVAIITPRIVEGHPELALVE